MFPQRFRGGLRLWSCAGNPACQKALRHMILHDAACINTGIRAAERRAILHYRLGRGWSTFPAISCVRRWCSALKTESSGRVGFYSARARGIGSGAAEGPGRNVTAAAATTVQMTTSSLTPRACDLPSTAAKWTPFRTRPPAAGFYSKEYIPFPSQSTVLRGLVWKLPHRRSRGAWRCSRICVGA
jgi:hypothetical protein